ncbi:MAG: phenylacetate--CoA ligase family protein [Candidatus Omnitrophota bacterium]|nr:MAG: phenylacetate--CoA ligase family protein [Candidatus Omnitrophota bacterium]
MSRVLHLYKRMPVGVRGALKWGYSFIPLRVRLGKDFFRQLAFLEKSQWWSPAGLENYQNEQLRKLIHHAYRNVPYYNRTFKALKLLPADIKTIQDLPKIPLLEKDAVRNNLDDFVAINFTKSQLAHITTSGTTGRILDIYSDPRNEFINGGPFEWRFYRWGKYNVDDLCAVFRAFFFKHRSLGKERIYGFNPVQKKVFFSIYDISEECIDAYAAALQRYPVQFLQGYPVSLKKLAELLRARNWPRPVSPKAIFTFAEMLLPEHRRIIEDYFGCGIFDWYGMEERTVIACECEERKGHHINSEFGVVEFIKNGVHIEKDTHEIVTTGLTNYAMPFIRYRTEDCGFPLKEKCSCQRGLPLMRVLGGRTRNYIIDREGNYQQLIGLLDLFSDFISQYQFVQKKKGEVEVRVVTKDNYNQKKEKLILGNLHKMFGSKFQFHILPVKEITQTQRGKIPLVVFAQRTEVS